MSRSNLRTAAISLMVLASCFVLNHDFALAQTPQLKAANNRIEAAEKAGNWEEMVRLMPSWVNGGRGIRTANGQRAANKLAAYYMSKAARGIRKQGKLDRALVIAQTARKYWEAGGRTVTFLTTLATVLGEIHEAKGDLVEADKMYRWALANAETKEDRHHTDVVGPLRDIADIRIKQKKYAEAEALLLRGLAIEERTHGKSHKYTGWVVEDLADLYREQGLPKKAKVQLDRLLPIYRQAYGVTSSQVAWVLDDLGDVFDDLGESEKSVEMHRQGLAVMQAATGSESSGTAALLNNYGNLLKRLGRLEEAEELHVRSLAIKRKLEEGDRDSLASSLNNLALVYTEKGRFKQAVEMHKESLAIRQKLHPKNDHKALVLCLTNLAESYEDWGRYTEAIEYLEQAVTISENLYGKEDINVARTLINLAFVHYRKSHYNEADQLYQRALPIFERSAKTNPTGLGACLSNFAILDVARGRYADAERRYNRALELYAPESTRAATAMAGLSTVYRNRGKVSEARKLLEKSLAITEQAQGADHADVAFRLCGLAGLEEECGHFRDAEKLYNRAIAIRERALGGDHPLLAETLRGQAWIYYRQNRLAEADAAYRRAMPVLEEQAGSESSSLAWAINGLACVRQDQGDFAQAEILYKRARGTLESHHGLESVEAATLWNNLGCLYNSQSRTQDAEECFDKALALYAKTSGTESPHYIRTLSGLADCYASQDNHKLAEVTHRRVLEMRQKMFGEDNLHVAETLQGLASLYREQGKLDEAEQHYQQALEIKEKVYGTAHSALAGNYYGLARVRQDQGRLTDAETLIDQAIDLRERTNGSPGFTSSCYKLRAQLAWAADRRGEAIADLRKAMSLAETVRHGASGAEHERATTFASYSDTFELMVRWQFEQGNHNEVLNAIERARARSLLDEIALSGTELDVGLSIVERDQRRQQLADLHAEVAKWEEALKKLEGMPIAPSEKRHIEVQLAGARAQLYDHYATSKSSSAVYRQLLSTGGGPPRMSQLKRSIVGDENLLLIYFLGEEAGYLLALGPELEMILTLEVNQAQADILGIQAGPLTAQRLRSALINEKKTGVLQLLSDPSLTEVGESKLDSLGTLLLPNDVRSSLFNDHAKRVLVVPDGPLALLPFEALRVTSDAKSEYLLDVAPPILYGPSATVLYSLGQRRQPILQDELRILTVGDPVYEEQHKESVPTDALASLAPRNRYGALSGGLPRLPHSWMESEWVEKAFIDSGAKVQQLVRGDATERNIRIKAKGNQILHFACHGLTDQEYGNFFGALAVSQDGQSTDDPGNDGFLSLPELYELDLKGTELTILSSCQTNYGPQQKGEGVWALSRGFLVSGSHRVVASNWLVDDEAAASLIGYYCDGLAHDIHVKKQPDFAEKLHLAKRWVRDQDKWSHPYYWASFVLVGPN